MHKKWVVAAKRADFNAIAEKFNISPYLARIIRNRDVIGDEQIEKYLNGGIECMHSPALLKDMDIAADILWDAIASGVKIRIVGDYDIDGVLASYILKRGIEFMGGKAQVRLPDRILDGYGLNDNIINEAFEAGVELIVTCDNGIAANKEIMHAVELGMSVIVTDHHEVPYEETEEGRRFILPPADAVIDPKREDCPYPFKGICGAMVAYKLIMYMLDNFLMPECMVTREASDKAATFASAVNAASLKELKEELLSFAAFATIGDVMELVDENRAAVKLGLETLRRTKNVGMKALVDTVGIDPEAIDVYHIGFILGPCINATGRLESAQKALELFFSKDYKEASVIAEELRNLNESRKNMTISFTKAAIDMVNESFPDDKVIVVYMPSCHESIAGIVAGKIRESFYRPSIVLTDDSEGNIKGSGRSIEGYNMYEELTKVNDIFTKYGGHKMAAGLSMKAGCADELRRRLNENCSLTEEELIEKMVIDIPLPVGYVTQALVDEMDRLSPYGVSNPKPLFAQKDVKVINAGLIGKNSNVCKLTLEGAGGDGSLRRINAVIFEEAQKAYEEIANHDKISVLYQASTNEYMGNRSVQLIIKDYAV